MQTNKITPPEHLNAPPEIILFTPTCLYGTLWCRFMIDLLIDSNGISARQRLFYALRLGNRIHCMFLFSFFVVFF